MIMRKTILLTLSLFMGLLTTNAQEWTWDYVNYRGAFPVTDNTTATDWTYGWTNWDPQNTEYPTPSMILSSDITVNTTIGGVVELQNKVYVRNGAVLTIQPGTIIRGDASTQATLIVTKGSKIIAQGTQNQPIVFTSNQPVGERAEGDWGGLVILGNAINNQPGGIANIEGIPASLDTEYGGTDNNDNSGILEYVRVEFCGIALEPNKEINGITFGSVGSGTYVNNVQVSYSGDDSFEWFGGTVNCKHLIAYSGIDDDFDTDFGYRGKVQFVLSIRNKYMYDAVGDSNAFESDNDGQGSANEPLTSPVFSNVTLVGPFGDDVTETLPNGETFEKAFRLRRNTSTSVFNSLVTGWEKGVSIEGTSTQVNVTNGDLVFANNILADLPVGSNCVSGTEDFYNSFFGVNNNDSTITIEQIDWVNLFVDLGLTPDARLSESNSPALGADFTHPLLSNPVVIGVDNKTTSNFTIYPNPTSEFLNVVSPNRTPIFVMNQVGQRVYEDYAPTTINLSNFEDGIYFIQTSNDVQKFVIQK